MAAIMPISSFEVAEGEEAHIMTVTKKGVVKKTVLQEYARPRKGGKIALTIREGDEILSAVLTDGSNDILLASKKGLSVRFNEKDVRSMGRTASGVRGINLSAEDEVVSVLVILDESSILAVTENGYGKRSAVDEYPCRHRGGKGVIAIKANERNGNVVGVLQVTDEDDVMLITDGGKIIRMSMGTCGSSAAIPRGCG